MSNINRVARIMPCSNTERQGRKVNALSETMSMETQKQCPLKSKDNECSGRKNRGEAKPLSHA